MRPKLPPTTLTTFLTLLAFPLPRLRRGLARNLVRGDDYTAIRPGLDTDCLVVDEAGMGATVLVGQVQGVTGEVDGAAAGEAFDEVGVVVP